MAARSAGPGSLEQESLLDHMSRPAGSAVSPLADFQVTPYLQANPDVRDARRGAVEAITFAGYKERRRFRKPKPKRHVSLPFICRNTIPIRERTLGGQRASLTGRMSPAGGRCSRAMPADPSGRDRFYDCGCEKAKRRRQRWPRNLGSTAFCVHYYWFNGYRVLEASAQQPAGDARFTFLSSLLGQ